MFVSTRVQRVPGGRAFGGVKKEDKKEGKKEKQERQGEFNIQEEREEKKGPHCGHRFLCLII